MGVPKIDLEALDEYLMSNTSPVDSMLLSDLDGFLTGIVAGPEAVPSSEWLPVIWGGKEPEFETEQQAQVILGTIMGRYNEIAAVLKSDPDRLEPIFYEGPDGTLIVTDWAAGFLDAIKLHRKAWEPLFKHRRAKILLVPLVILGDDEDFFEHHPSPHEKEFYASAPNVLQTCVIGIHDFWRDHGPDRQKPNPRRKQRPGRRVKR
jgi:uncharacterized protein